MGSSVCLQVHDRYGNFPSFGDGDLKQQGIEKFFESHRCNHWCRAMGLKSVSHYHWIAPREVVKFPGVSARFLEQLTEETLKKVRARHKLAELWRIELA